MKPFLLLILAGIAASVAPPPAQALELSPEFSKCIGDGPAPGYASSMATFVRACAPPEAARQDQALNAAYAAQRAKVSKTNPGAVEKLVAAQRQWIAFRDAWCAYDALIYDAPDAETATIMCKASLSQEQTERLK